MPVHTRYSNNERNSVRHVVHRKGVNETVFSYRPDGILKYICQLRHGKRHGYTLLFKNETKTKCIHFRNGMMHGKFSTYDDNGTLQTTSYFRNGKAHGVFKKFSEEGVLQQKFRYKHGKIHGKILSYANSGAMSIFEPSPTSLAPPLMFEYSADGTLTKRIQHVTAHMYSVENFTKDGHVALQVLLEQNDCTKAIVYDENQHILEECMLDENYQHERDTLYCNDVTAVQYSTDIIECNVCMEKTRFETLCHHGLCLSCAMKWIQENDEYFTCPTCRHDEYRTLFE